MKVQELLNILEGDPEAEVCFSTGPGEHLEMLSIYPSKNGKKVWIDLGKKGE